MHTDGKQDGQETPIALESYEALAERYARLVDAKPENAYYEMPATLSLLPDVKGKRVLDAGCGPGRYAEWLAEHGAVVTALDLSPKMVEMARQRLGARAVIECADLGRPLDFLEDGSFDIVLCPLVLDHLRDWIAAFQEFRRILSENGLLVFSIGHPFAGFMQKEPAGNYFETERIDYTWRGFGEPHVVVPSYERPLQDVFSAVHEGGFTLVRLIEPRPTEEYKAADPGGYERLSRLPGFLCISAVRTGP